MKHIEIEFDRKPDPIALRELSEYLEDWSVVFDCPLQVVGWLE